jgi:hypothetical protein
MRAFIYDRRMVLTAVLASVCSIFPAATAQQSAGSAAAPKPDTVEWVYRIRYGYHDEWFRIATE